MGFPERVHKIDAVLRLKVNGIKQIYAFSGTQYWEYVNELRSKNVNVSLECLFQFYFIQNR